MEVRSHFKATQHGIVPPPPPFCYYILLLLLLPSSSTQQQWHDIKHGYSQCSSMISRGPCCCIRPIHAVITCVSFSPVSCHIFSFNLFQVTTSLPSALASISLILPLLLPQEVTRWEHRAPFSLRKSYRNGVHSVDVRGVRNIHLFSSLEPLMDS